MSSKRTRTTAKTADLKQLLLDCQEAIVELDSLQQRLTATIADLKRRLAEQDLRILYILDYFKFERPVAGGLILGDSRQVERKTLMEIYIEDRPKFIAHCAQVAREFLDSEKAKGQAAADGKNLPHDTQADSRSGSGSDQSHPSGPPGSG